MESELNNDVLVIHPQPNDADGVHGRVEVHQPDSPYTHEDNLQAQSPASEQVADVQGNDTEEEAINEDEENPEVDSRGEREREDEDEEDPDGDGDEPFQDTYKDALNALSRKWYLAQLSQKVSAKAANHYWDLSLQCLPEILNMKDREGRLNNIPKFIQQRRILNNNHCPDVNMEYAFKNKNDGSITRIFSTSTPLKALQRNPDYIKLYEIATIKVIQIPT